MRGRLLALLGFYSATLGCSSGAAPERAAPALERSTATAATVQPPRQVFVDTLAVPGDQPVFTLRGGRETGVVGVVLHGWCSHGMGFLQAFQWSAADVGRFIALQGEHHCGGSAMRGWSNDDVGLDRRIDAALRAYLGGEIPPEILLVGSSQGADRAVALARRFPAKYRWLILSSGPSEISAAGLSRLSGAYFFVGQHEGRAVMQRSAAALRRAGIRSELRVIDGAGHADFHGQGDPLLKRAFIFLGVAP
jgi:pimeloyl-ACP methyl ester carboxylesterase